MSVYEVNFDGLVGPTHNYAGLSFGNVASSDHGGLTSSPKDAAIQGLDKMMSLQRMGLKQAVLPPQERPHLASLNRLGFSGDSPGKILDRVYREAPNLLAAVSSASSMWAANAATISPFADTADGKTHITPANLNSMFHRSIEVESTSAILAAIFSGEQFCHHPALPSGITFSDEGAANHTRFCREYGEPGVALFVYGVSVNEPATGPTQFPARQTLQASQAIARQHGLAENKTVFAQQNPEAVDAGVFHNDVIAVGNRELFFYHQQAFLNSVNLRQQLDSAFGDEGLHYIEVPAQEVSMSDAVASYLFNSQLLSVPGKSGTSIVVPAECKENPAVNRYLDELEADSKLIDEIIYFDLRQSMNNGGGPACLRLRVVMNQQQIDTLQARVFLDDNLYLQLRNWIQDNYRDRLAPDDLKDPALLDECHTALDSLTQLLKLGSVYEFQQS